MTAIAKATLQPGDVLLEVNLGKHFKITPRGLEVVGEPSFNECGQLWGTLHTFEKTIQFAIGDAAKYIRGRFGERADQIISAATGWAFETLRAYEWTAEKVPKSVRRMDVLDYSHHQAVARLNPTEQKQWLDKAADGDGDGTRWSVAKLKAAVKAGTEPEVEAWVLIVACKSERDRDRLRLEMEGRGLVCAVGERRRRSEKGERA